MKNNGLLALAVGFILGTIYMMDTDWEGAQIIKLFSLLCCFISFVFIVESIKNPIEK